MRHKGERLVRKAVRVFVAGCLLVALIVSLYGLFQWMFRVRTVEVIGEGIALHVDPSLLPKNLLFLSSEQLERDLGLAYPLLATVDVQKKFPHTLVIAAYIREPFARLVTPEQSVILDKDGIVVSFEEPENRSLPTLYFETGSLGIGQKIVDPPIVQSLAFIQGSEALLAEVVIRQYDGSSLRAQLGKVSIFFPQEGDGKQKAATLQTLLVGFRIKGTLPKTIDLRFEKPIVTF